MRSHAVTMALVAVVGTGLLGAAAQDLSRRDAESLARKLTSIASRAAAPAARQAAPVRTPITEREVNAYLKFSAPEELPKGVVNPVLTLMGDRRVAAQATVDLDAVRTSRPRGWLDPAAYLTGTVDVQATGTVRTADGKGSIDVESATVGGVPVPQSLLQELVSYYSRSPEHPEGFELGKPFELPASIREVEIQRGAATIVQY